VIVSVIIYESINDMAEALNAIADAETTRGVGKRVILN